MKIAGDMSRFESIRGELAATPQRWLVTGVAGFIGSHLLETLLELRQRVVGLDNLSTGYRRNLDQVRTRVGEEHWKQFRFIQGDIGELAVCQAACEGVELVLHEAALGSVPGSLADPLGAHQSNVTGFLNMLMAAREAGVRRLVYASSSAVYGEDPQQPKVESKTGELLSPYAATKAMNEVYAGVFARAYHFDSVGLRYFNVFGPRQDPAGPYAAVIPKWLAGLLNQEPVFINGDGENTRDFCYIANVVQANLLAATAKHREALNQVYNIALGERTSLNELFRILQKALHAHASHAAAQKPVYRESRRGDIRHSVADISKARRLLGYEPEYRLEKGLELAVQWFLENRQVSKDHSPASVARR